MKVLLLASEYLVLLEEEGDLFFRRLRAVRSVDRVPLYAHGEISADRPCRSFRWVGRPHNLPIAGNRILPFQNHHENRPRGHKVDELLIKGPILMDYIEFLRFFLRKVDHFGGDYAQAFPLEIFNDIANLVLAYGVWLDNRVCSTVWVEVV